ncbi:J domain-containing protein [Parasphingorhabdus halotolerans]|uniref:J domain-containing protein n=1 Tax=Parasphingorhabdus halotolerans TaxID=2725558 RepID=A0A6H2DMM1_9SPHN|nr:J domain-containing protein [Parasphingorhabdus halotolerans]QJB69630.1 J domain-containing protein [Parasphingorhabdus halotolerans]
MTPILIIGGAIIAWLVFSGKAKTMTGNQWLALVVALLGANMLRGGNWIFGGSMLAGAAFLSGWRILIPAKSDKINVRKPRDFELDRARSLLGVSEDADRETIDAAWRDRLAEHHPGQGGDEQLAKQINRARDILLEQMEAQSRDY